MPREFWREVVDRVAAGAPGTLLLAEAFWLMEGYFVRTLGMHRVYNSAFMVMLRDERNADFRRVMREHARVRPGVLQALRQLHEQSRRAHAVDQFGRGDKYFGVCTLMATLPGFRCSATASSRGSRSAMAWSSAVPCATSRWTRASSASTGAASPLLRVRSRFAGSEEFLLYDCRDASGHVNEDVFAFSNRDGSGAALVLYHNRWSRCARGTFAGRPPTPRSARRFASRCASACCSTGWGSRTRRRTRCSASATW
jgi:hypothetical protein